MTPEERGIALAKAAPPLTDQQVEEIARILWSVAVENCPTTVRRSSTDART